MNIPNNQAALNHSACSLTIEHLQCIRDDRILFDDLNFNLSAGQLLQIEGHNGSGKTSLLRILCGLTLPTEGIIHWNNQDIQEIKSDYWANLAYIGHANGVKAELTPLENLAMAQALAATPISIDLVEALDQVGLYGFEDVPTRTLSAGQQRRVALARLLVTNNQLWILDEPFTALDKAAIRALEKRIDEHVNQGGIAILTSHHTVNCKDTIFLHLSDQ
jgi:heme exporter protein A